MKAQNMSPLVSANPLGTFDFKTLIRSDAAFGFPRVRSKRPCSIKSDIRFVCASSKPSPSKNSDEIGADEVRASVFEKWEVPWDWKTTLYVMLPYLMSIFLTGFVKSAGFTGGMLSQSGDAQTHLGVDEMAIRLFVDQLLKTAVKLGILYLLVSPYRPLPDDIFSFRWGRPFDIRLGWFLWACGGLIVAASAVFLVEAVISSPTVGRESEMTDINSLSSGAETLTHLLPLIGSSNISTLCLFCILGILAPFCEETLYRGFLMTSLTKWLPLPISVTVSSAVFALAHQSPGNLFQIFIFGNVLGLVYARTRNLLTPILMHAWWNIGVILALTILQTQGYDIQKYML